MEIKDYVKQFRDLQKSHKKVRVADFCRENMLDYYEMVEALKQEKFVSESRQIHEELQEEGRYCYLQYNGGGYAAYSGRDEQGCSHAGSGIWWWQ